MVSNVILNAPFTEYTDGKLIFRRNHGESIIRIEISGIPSSPTCPSDRQGQAFYAVMDVTKTLWDSLSNTDKVQTMTAHWRKCYEAKIYADYHAMKATEQVRIQ